MLERLYNKMAILKSGASSHEKVTQSVCPWLYMYVFLFVYVVVGVCVCVCVYLCSLVVCDCLHVCVHMFLLPV